MGQSAKDHMMSQVPRQLQAPGSRKLLEPPPGKSQEEGAVGMEARGVSLTAG